MIAWPMGKQISHLPSLAAMMSVMCSVNSSVYLLLKGNSNMAFLLP